MKRLITTLGLLGFLGTLVAGAAPAAAANVSIYVNFGPPAPVYEAPPPPPYYGAVWVPGYYRYDDDRYEWHRGYYSRPPFQGAVYQPGRWVQRGPHWVFVAGYWGHGRGYGYGHVRRDGGDHEGHRGDGGD